MTRRKTTPAKATTPQTGGHGKALMQYVDAALDATGTAPTSWARAHGITATNLAKWRDGHSEPGLSTIEQIAEALGRRTVELLIAAGYITAEDVGITVVVPERRVDIDDAIENDPTLSDVEREVLRAARQMGQAARAGTRTPQARKIPLPPQP